MKFAGMVIFLLAAACSPATLTAQTKLSPRWEELTAPDFRDAIQQAKGACLLPFGILEKHGQHLPLGTDLLNVRYASLQAVSQEYAVVFPEYYFGQIFEAKHEPGTVAYSMDLQLHLLQETTDEMARNGCKKIIIVNGHGGNEHLLPFFAQTQLDGCGRTAVLPPARNLEPRQQPLARFGCDSQRSHRRRRSKPHDYVVYVLDGERSRPGGPPKKSSGIDYHAGENETSNTIISRPDLVHLDRAKNESGADQKRLNLPENLYTGIWWYARFPNHYSGDGSVATKELGEWNMKGWIDSVVECIRSVKADDNSLKLQNEFYEKSNHPLGTRP